MQSKLQLSHACIPWVGVFWVLPLLPCNRNPHPTSPFLPWHACCGVAIGESVSLNPTPAGPTAGCVHLSLILLVVLIAFYMHLAWLEVVCWAKAVSFIGDVPVPLVLLLSLALSLLFGTCSVSSSD
jgi:hypothetical protein